MKLKKIFSAMTAFIIALIGIPFSLSDVKAEEPVIWDGTYDTSWYDSEDTELHISTAEEFAGFAQLVNSGQRMEDKTIYLDNDIYLNDVSDFDNWEEEPPENKWIPIGSLEMGVADETYFFSGIFNGNNHCIYGMYISESIVFGNTIVNHEHFVGLFSGCYGSIENLRLENTYIQVEQSVTYYGTNTGGIAGACLQDGSITNCSVEGKITAKGYAGKSMPYTRTGGICGVIKYGGIISKCRSKSTILVYARNTSHNWDTYTCVAYAGGICGEIYYDFGTIEKCVNYGEIMGYRIDGSSSGTAYAAGICGSSLFGNITDCYNVGTIYSVYAAGGIVGKALGNSDEPSVVTNTYNRGGINADYHGGGIVGTLENAILDNTYFLSGTALTGVGSGNDTSISKSSSNMRKEPFAESLGDAFVYVENDYPKLAWETGEELIQGDIDSDGEVTITDVIILYKYLHNVRSFTQEEWERSDLYKDGNVDVFDLVILKRILLNTN